jgi:hypothetical protein
MSQGESKKVELIEAKKKMIITSSWWSVKFGKILGKGYKVSHRRNKFKRTITQTC